MSFIRTGRSTLLLTAVRNSSFPSKCLGSVSTEMPAAPPRWYFWAISRTSVLFLSSPSEGERNLTSVIRGTPWAATSESRRLLCGRPASFTT